MIGYCNYLYYLFDERTVYTYTADGQPVQVRHFTEVSEADMVSYDGEEPEWIDWRL